MNLIMQNGQSLYRTITLDRVLTISYEMNRKLWYEAYLPVIPLHHRDLISCHYNTCTLAAFHRLADGHQERR